MILKYKCIYSFISHIELKKSNIIPIHTYIESIYVETETNSDNYIHEN